MDRPGPFARQRPRPGHRLEDLKPGDLLRVKQFYHQLTGFEFPDLGDHWAVYVGNQEIVHMREDMKKIVYGNLEKLLLFNDSVEICNDANSSGLKLRRYITGRYEPWEIVAKAKKAVGTEELELQWLNCEHFAIDCGFKILEQKSESLGCAYFNQKTFSHLLRPLIKLFSCILKFQDRPENIYYFEYGMRILKDTRNLIWREYFQCAFFR